MRNFVLFLLFLLSAASAKALISRPAAQEKLPRVLTEELIHEREARQKDCDGEEVGRKNKRFFCEDEHQK